MKQLRTLIEGKDIWWGMITMLLIVSLIGMGWYCLVTGKEIRHVELVVMQLFGFLTMLLGFRYGSSKGSKEKDKQQQQQNETSK
jgi:hypothetical protein